MSDIAREMEERDAEIKKLISLSAEGAHYSLQNTYLNSKQKDAVEGWFQLPLHIQSLAAIALTVVGFQWWQAILLAWIPSTLSALAIRRSKSVTVGRIGHGFRWLAQGLYLISAIAAGFQSEWVILVMSVAAFFGPLGMICPAMALMSAGSKAWSPKYDYASRAFAITFPFQAAADRLEAIRQKPLSNDEQEYLKAKYLPK